jgi:hypothetical protein
MCKYLYKLVQTLDREVAHPPMEAANENGLGNRVEIRKLEKGSIFSHLNLEAREQEYLAS